MKSFKEKPTYDELVDLLIEASTLEDFLKIQALFVPDKNVNAWLKKKNKHLNWLDQKCAWEKHEFRLNSEERLARERYLKIMGDLKEYEQRFGVKK